VRHTKPILGAILCLAPATSAFAATTNPEAPYDAMKVTSLEEVVVTGRLDTLSGIKKAIIDAEDRFYERFNELSKGETFDIRCRNEAPIGTRLKRRTCVPGAHDDATRMEAMRFMGLTEGNVKLASAYEIQMAMQYEQRKRTLEMLNHDPELRRALLEHARLKQMYDAMRARKFEGRTIVWD
jgi:hypothetical protein